MLVERLLVCALAWFYEQVAAVAKHTQTGARQESVQVYAGADQGLDQDLDVVHDRRAQASQVPATALRET
jgi:hypothetical protein